MLSIATTGVFWDALWLELWPFSYFIVESRRIACRCLHTTRGAICYRMSVSTPSGTLCGSSYGRFCIGRHFGSRNDAVARVRRYPHPRHSSHSNILEAEMHPAAATATSFEAKCTPLQPQQHSVFSKMGFEATTYFRKKIGIPLCFLKWA